MDFSSFVELYRLRARKDKCGDAIVPGKFGHIYEHGAGKFGISLEDSVPGPSQRRTLIARRRRALAAGFTMHQEGDYESIMLFDPEDQTQSRLAIQLVKVRIRRTATPEQVEHLRRARESRGSLLNRRKPR